MSVTGRLEEVRGRFARGWAMLPADLKRRVEVEIVEGATVIAAGEARFFHFGLYRQRTGDAHYRFIIPLPASVFDGELHILHARDSTTKTLLPGEYIIARAAPRGQIEGISAHVLFGWVAKAPKAKAPRLEVRVDGKAVGSARATLKRPDIAANKLAEAAAGFRFDLAPHLKAGADHSIAVIDTATGRELVGSPISLAKAPAWGVLDTAGGVELGGWAVTTAPAAGPAIVEILVDGRVVAEVPADRPRQDLRRIGVKQVRCGFHCAVPERFYDGAGHVLAVRVKGAQTLLRGTPRRLCIAIRHQIESASARRIAGWITNLAAPNQPIHMDAWENGKRVGTAVADAPREDVAEQVFKRKNASVPAGFVLRLAPPKRGWKERRIRLTVQGTQAPLTGKDIVLAADRRRKPPVSYREARIPAEPDTRIPVDVIVPVCEDGEEVLACVQSVLNSRDPTPFQLIVIDDKVLDPAALAGVRHLAEYASFTFLMNPKRVGFAATIEAATLLHPGRDVILLHPCSTVPEDDWMSRLRKNAYANARVASVSASSEDGALPPSACIYICRAALNDVGTMAGGAEGETVMQFRARAAGLNWTHRTASDVLIATDRVLLPT